MEKVTGPGARMGAAARSLHLKCTKQRWLNCYLESNEESQNFFKQESILNGFAF